jgi:hypothetical protein
MFYAPFGGATVYVRKNKSLVSIPPTSCKVRQGNPFAIMKENGPGVGSFDPLNIVLLPFVLLADECNRAHAKWTVNYVRVSTVGSH